MIVVTQTFREYDEVASKRCMKNITEDSLNISLVNDNELGQEDEQVRSLPSSSTYFIALFSSSAKATNPDLEPSWRLRHHLLGDCLLGHKF